MSAVLAASMVKMPEVSRKVNMRKFVVGRQELYQGPTLFAFYRNTLQDMRDILEKEYDIISQVKYFKTHNPRFCDHVDINDTWNYNHLSNISKYEYVLNVREKMLDDLSVMYITILFYSYVIDNKLCSNQGLFELAREQGFDHLCFNVPELNTILCSSEFQTLNEQLRAWFDLYHNIYRKLTTSIAMRYVYSNQERMKFDDNLLSNYPYEEFIRGGTEEDRYMYMRLENRDVDEIVNKFNALSRIIDAHTRNSNNSTIVALFNTEIYPAVNYRTGRTCPVRYIVIKRDDDSTVHSNLMNVKEMRKWLECNTYVQGLFEEKQVDEYIVHIPLISLYNYIDYSLAYGCTNFTRTPADWRRHYASMARVKGYSFNNLEDLERFGASFALNKRYGRICMMGMDYVNGSKLMDERVMFDLLRHRFDIGLDIEEPEDLEVPVWDDFDESDDEFLNEFRVEQPIQGQIVQEPTSQEPIQEHPVQEREVIIAPEWDNSDDEEPNVQEQTITNTPNHIPLNEFIHQDVFNESITQWDTEPGTGLFRYSVNGHGDMSHMRGIKSFDKMLSLCNEELVLVEHLTIHQEPGEQTYYIDGRKGFVPDVPRLGITLVPPEHKNIRYPESALVAEDLIDYVEKADTRLALTRQFADDAIGSRCRLYRNGNSYANNKLAYVNYINIKDDKLESIETNVPERVMVCDGYNEASNIIDSILVDNEMLVPTEEDLLAYINEMFAYCTFEYAPDNMLCLHLTTSKYKEIFKLYGYTPFMRLKYFKLILNRLAQEFANESGETVVSRAIHSFFIEDVDDV